MDDQAVPLNINELMTETIGQIPGEKPLQKEPEESYFLINNGKEIRSHLRVVDNKLRDIPIDPLSNSRQKRVVFSQLAQLKSQREHSFSWNREEGSAFFLDENFELTE